MVAVICADCGKTIERTKDGQWANQAGDQWWFTCRFELDGDRVVCADYHYVDGEQQRHFTTQEGTVCGNDPKQQGANDGHTGANRTDR